MTARGPSDREDGAVKGQVVVRLKPEVLDPQGVTISKALNQLGYDEVTELRAGKVFDVEIDTNDRAAAEARLHEMAKELLANPVIENYTVRLLDDSDSDHTD